MVDPAHTFPSFEVSHLGISTTRGRFERTTGEMTLDDEARFGAMEIAIDAGRVSTGNATIDSWLKSDTFFDVERHPRILFRSRGFVPGHMRPFRAEGELTLLGNTRPVILSVERFGCTTRAPGGRKTCGADMSTTISRAAFGMKGYAGVVGDEVRLEIQFEAIAEDAAAPSREENERWK